MGSSSGMVLGVRGKISPPGGGSKPEGMRNLASLQDAANSIQRRVLGVFAALRPPATFCQAFGLRLLSLPKTSLGARGLVVWRFSRRTDGFDPFLGNNYRWRSENRASRVIWIQGDSPAWSCARRSLQVKLCTSDEPVQSHENFLRTNGKPHNGTGEQVCHIDGAGSNTPGSKSWVGMNRSNIKALKFGPCVSVFKLHLEGRENIWVGGVIRYFKSHGRYATGLDAVEVANRD